MSMAVPPPAKAALSSLPLADTEEHPSRTPVTVVVAHCAQSLAWLSPALEQVRREYTDLYSLIDVFIYSKCNQPVVSAPPNSYVIRLPNVGRNDHSYVFFISQMKLTRGVVLFLKDTQNTTEQRRGTENDSKGFGAVRGYGEMIAQALSPEHFSCRQYIDEEQTGLHNEVVTKVLLTWTARFFRQKTTLYATHVRTHFSNYAKMRQWVTDMKIPLPKPLMAVCYGGEFAVSVEQLRQVDRQIWLDLRQSLSRGSNIQERFFMQRTWAGLLAPPPPVPPSLTAKGGPVRCFKTDVCGHLGHLVEEWSVLKEAVLCGKEVSFFLDSGQINRCTIRRNGTELMRSDF
jgi:hypothetical protein